MSSPAQVIKKLLLDQTLAVAGVTAKWVAFVSFLPDDPDTAMVLYDTAGTQNGRLMRGPKITHPGLQVRFRSSVYTEVWEKANAVANAFDNLTPRTQVVISPSETWEIQNISRTGDIVNMGVEEQGDRKRHNLTVNAILTLRKKEA